MAEETRFKIWGYWTKNGTDKHHQRKCIGDAETIEEARQLRADAEKIGWPTVCIFEGGLIVEPTHWSGQQHPSASI